MKSQNIDKLSQDELDLLALLMLQPNAFWPSSYMIEVRLDSPYTHLLNGEKDTLHVHAGGGSRHYAKNYDNQDWAIVHIEDENVKDWNWKEMAERAAKKLGVELP